MPLCCWSLSNFSVQNLFVSAVYLMVKTRIILPRQCEYFRFAELNMLFIILRLNSSLSRNVSEIWQSINEIFKDACEETHVNLPTSFS